MKVFDLTLRQKIVLTVLCFACAFIGFMVKLPSGLHHMDKELHATFYFLAAAFLNILFAGTKIVRHAIIFGALYLFGIGIEFAQDYSNRFYRKRIHGRFDPEDVHWNLKGLLAFSLVWVVCVAVIVLYRKVAVKDSGYKSKVQ